MRGFRRPLPLIDVGLVETSWTMSHEAEFERFARTEAERLRRVLVAQHGVDLGNDLASDAIAYAWEHWDRVGGLTNPVGYLYRVAQTSGRDRRRRQRPVPFLAERPPDVEHADPALAQALMRLAPVPRACVVLVHVYGWSYGEVAESLNVSEASIRNHLHRGVRKLRDLLENKS